MTTILLHTDLLDLNLQSTEDVLARIAAMPAADQAEVSPDWIARLRAAPAPSPWTHGVVLVERASGAEIGSAGFKAAPDADGMVELAYGITPEYQRRGF